MFITYFKVENQDFWVTLENEGSLNREVRLWVFCSSEIWTKVDDKDVTPGALPRQTPAKKVPPTKAPPKKPAQ